MEQEEDVFNQPLQSSAGLDGIRTDYNADGGDVNEEPASPSDATPEPAVVADSAVEASLVMDEEVSNSYPLSNKKLLDIYGFTKNLSSFIWLP